MSPHGASWVVGFMSYSLMKCWFLKFYVVKIQIKTGCCSGQVQTTSPKLFWCNTVPIDPLQACIEKTWLAWKKKNWHGLNLYYYFILHFTNKVASRFFQKPFVKSTFFIHILKIYVKIDKKCFGCIKKYQCLHGMHQGSILGMVLISIITIYRESKSPPTFCKNRS